jgi:hypothetical protein
MTLLDVAALVDYSIPKKYTANSIKKYLVLRYSIVQYMKFQH